MPACKIFTISYHASNENIIFLFSPVVDHELIDDSRTASGRGKTNSFVNESNTVLICVFLKWFVSKTPYLIHNTTKAPHITSSGVLLVENGLC